MSCGRKGGCNILTGSHHGLLFCSYVCAGHFWSDHHKFHTLLVLLCTKMFGKVKGHSYTYQTLDVHVMLFFHGFYKL